MPLIQWIMQNLNEETNVSGSANLICSSSLSAQPNSSNHIIGQGGVVVSGSAVVNVHSNIIFSNIGHGGAQCGGSANVTFTQHQIAPPCLKPPLPLNPKPSIANYTPQNIAPLIEFFQPIVSGVLGKNVGLCQMVFRYENNTPCIYTDDIFVRFPTCIPVPYSPQPPPTGKSQALLQYEAAAKNSVALYNFMINSPAKIIYFNGTEKHQILQ
jgi:hypothetical protein